MALPISSTPSRRVSVTPAANFGAAPVASVKVFRAFAGSAAINASTARVGFPCSDTTSSS
jgi:hypothetical protein